ncbi:Immunoglobulin E-set domain protein [Pseudohyphozyma bogoriensis]|nr:Immunoglobulin E-set domain protein [Pseudohyphozyma bogoriensis]
MSRQPFGQKPWDPRDADFKARSSSKSRPDNPRSRSGSPMFGGLLASPTLRVTIAEEILFLHPADGETPTEDPWLSGSVTLWLPKARTLKQLTVRLQGRQDIGYPDGRPYESAITLDKVVSLLEKDLELEKGEHTFAFSIIVPSSTGPYERCQHGRLRHTVVAKAEGIGGMGGDIVSNTKQLFLIVNPGGAGESEPPPSLDHKIEGMVDEIGPYTMALQSQHIMVGGLMLLRFNLLSPPADMMIFSIKVKINQHFVLKSFTSPGFTSTPPVDSRTVCQIDATNHANFGKVEEKSIGGRSGSQTPAHGPMKILSKGESFTLFHLARLPNDNMIRPSTHPGTDTGINVTHTASIEMTYKIIHDDAEKEKAEKGKGKETPKDKRKLVVSKPLEIFSCCCFLDSLTLPAYSLLDPNTTQEREWEAPPCVCSMMIGEVIKFHGDKLLRAEGEPGLTYAPLQKSGTTTPTEGRAWSTATWDAVKNLVLEHKVVIFKDQGRLDPRKQLQIVTRYCGGREGVNMHARDPHQFKLRAGAACVIPDVPQTQVIGCGVVPEGHYGLDGTTIHQRTSKHLYKTPLTPEEEDSGIVRLVQLHFDGALYEVEPPEVGSLYCVAAPKGERLSLRFDNANGDATKSIAPGSTIYFDMSQAYTLLTPEQQRLVDHSRVAYAPRAFTWMSTTHFTEDGASIYSEGLETPLDDLPPWKGELCKTYPMVWINPLTHEKSLQVHGQAAHKLFLKDGPDAPERIVEDLAEVRKVVRELHLPFLKPEYAFSAEYEEGDALLWYNMQPSTPTPEWGHE